MNTVIQRRNATREETNITLNIGQTTIPKTRYGGGRNTVKYVKNVCDRVAAGKIYLDDKIQTIIR